MIREINLFEYLKDFESLRTELSDYYIRTKNCRILGAYEDGGVGFLLCQESRIREVLILCAENNNIRIKDDLLRTFLDELPSGIKVRWRILNDTQNENKQIAVGRGFVMESLLHVFHYDCLKPDFAEEMQDAIDKYTDLNMFMERHGYVTKPFSELTDDELHQIRDNTDGEFETYLQSGEHIRGNTGKLDEKCSFATVRDGKVFAYVIVVAYGGVRAVVENMSVARSARKGGTFLLPFIHVLGALKHSDYEAISFAIYETNADALPLMRKHFPKFLTSEMVQYNYLFTGRK